MIEILASSIAGIMGVILFRFLAITYENKRQERMQQEVADIKKRQEALNAQIKKEDKITQEKINDITEEQNKKITTSDLVDFFNNNKGKH